jgi:hypothetical protein
MGKKDLSNNTVNMDHQQTSLGFSLGGVGGATNEGIKELFHFDDMVDLMQKTDIPSSAVLPFMELCNIAYAMESNLLKAMLENYMRVRVSVDRKGRGELERVSEHNTSQDQDDGGFGGGMKW